MWHLDDSYLLADVLPINRKKGGRLLVNSEIHPLHCDPIQINPEAHPCNLYQQHHLKADLICAQRRYRTATFAESYPIRVVSASFQVSTTLRRIQLSHSKSTVGGNTPYHLQYWNCHLPVQR